MASVNFLLRSAVKKNDPFTARLQFSNPSKITDSNKFGLDFVEVKTRIFVFNPEEVKEMPLVDGQRFWKEFKKYKGSDINIKNRIERINSEQNKFRSFILDRFEAAYPEGCDSLPSKEWLSSVAKEYYDDIIRAEARKKNLEKPNELIWHFDNYIKVKGLELKPRTILKLQDTKKIVAGFEEFQSSIKGYSFQVLIPDVDELLKYDLVSYLQNNMHYSKNTIAKTIKIIRTICNYSKRYGIELSPMYEEFRMAYDDKDVVYLSFEELQTIKNADLPDELDNARKWLYISSFLGQRISDFMRFEKTMIRRDGTAYFIDFVQAKTNKKMALLLHPEVVKILKENDMNFPAAIDEPAYNDQIRKVCELSGLTEKVKGSILTEIDKGVWRNVEGVYPKYKLISSHIGRKSYCTNFYGKIPTALILEVSGHSEERTLLEYIGKKDASRSEMIKNYYQNIDITKD
ncbi:Uncharacterised protein [Chryseobacterium taklimakanense]|uniref:Phage integrase SAM-like domain-containing protein n=1 Tax=Chryseobacterium taklimakanense TaxID=536441 RepID=A0A239XM66_9FLAO|nr:phage integrase SAM-like domain-containing protein [Chryseobacterium taklimakanense]SNV48129.1 Uncharacterised protein [Chryseobacterium taklimakanense]